MIGQTSQAFLGSATALTVIYRAIQNGFSGLADDGLTQLNPCAVATSGTVSRYVNPVKRGALSGSVAFVRPDGGNDVTGGPGDPDIQNRIKGNPDYANSLRPLGVYFNTSTGNNAFDNTTTADSGILMYMSGGGTYKNSLYETYLIADVDPANAPAKTEILRRVELAGEQRDLYETVRLAMHERVRQAVAARGQHAQTGGLLTGGTLGAMARCHVPDLVPDHARQLSFAVQVGQDPARDVDIAARQGEGVDLRAVQDGECPCQVRPVGLGRQALADLVDVGLQGGGVVHALLADHLLMGLGALGDLIGLVHHRALGFAGHGVDDQAAAAGEAGTQQQGKQRMTHGAGKDGCEQRREGSPVHSRPWAWPTG